MIGQKIPIVRGEVTGLPILRLRRSSLKDGFDLIVCCKRPVRRMDGLILGSLRPVPVLEIERLTSETIQSSWNTAGEAAQRLLYMRALLKSAMIRDELVKWRS